MVYLYPYLYIIFFSHHIFQITWSINHSPCVDHLWLLHTLASLVISIWHHFYKAILPGQNQISPTVRDHLFLLASLGIPPILTFLQVVFSTPLLCNSKLWEEKKLPFFVFSGWHTVGHIESINMDLKRDNRSFTNKTQSFENVPGSREEVSNCRKGVVRTKKEKIRGHQNHFYLNNFALGSTQSNVNGGDRSLKLLSISNTLSGNYSIHCK